MHAQSVPFDARYSPELIDQATRAFRDYRFRQYGLILISACIVNALGLALAFWFSRKMEIIFFPLVFIVAVGPIWLLYQYFLEPVRQAARLKRVLPPRVRMSVGLDALSVMADERDGGIPWTLVKALLETDALFLLVLSPFSFTFIPKADLPVGAHEALSEKARSPRVGP